MKRKYNLLLLTVLSILLVYCSPKIPFTQTIREQYNLGENELKALQFYNSHDIVLNRGERSENQQEAIKGALTIKTGQSLEQVIIKAGTPGLVESVPGSDKVKVGFEVGENTGLVFGVSNKTKNERYSLMAPEWDNERGKLQYAGQTYYTSKGSGDTYLLFKMRRLNKYIKKQRVVKGMKI